MTDRVCDKPHLNDPNPCEDCGYPGDPHASSNRGHDPNEPDTPSAWGAFQKGRAIPKQAAEVEHHMNPMHLPDYWQGKGQKIGGHQTPNRVQICGYCGRSETPIWHADDDLYAQVTEGIISCPDCFTDVCRRKGIKLVWRPVRNEDSLDANGDWAW
jgi:hypothetical protein